HADIVVRIAGVPDKTIPAPKGTKGAWQHILRYGLTQEVTVAVRRRGFTPEILRITAEGKRSHAQIRLLRGPLWQTDLQAIPTTQPVASGAAILVGASRSTLEVIDGNLGGSRPVIFADSVSAVVSTPFVFARSAFVVLD